MRLCDVGYKVVANASLGINDSNSSAETSNCLTNSPNKVFIDTVTFILWIEIVIIESSMATTTIQTPGSSTESPKASPAWVHKEPLQPQGVLNEYDSFDVTPIIGREFPNANLKEWLEAPNSDELLRELAITSQYLHFSHREPSHHNAESLFMGISRSRRGSW